MEPPTVALLEEPERDAPRLETERRGEPGGARADDHDVAARQPPTISASRSATWSPCTIAFRMSPIPPSSPTTWTPGREDSKNSSTSGRSTPRSAVPKTSRMAPTGHSAAQRP